MSAAEELDRPIVGLVLAGGRSSRMFATGDAAAGADICDKGLLDIGGSSMLTRVVDRLRAQVRHVVLNANGDPARFAGLELPVVADPVEGFVGPLAGVLAGLQWCRREAPQAVWVVSAASDTPFFPSDLVARLHEAADDEARRIVLARTNDGQHPVFGLWPVALADDLATALERGVRKVLQWTDGHDCRTVHFADVTIGGETLDAFFNVNTPEDLARARRLVEARDS
jgi:molybdopterin-guanine dinucleotide biosynthesis protein A